MAFYALKRELGAVDSAAALRAFEAALKDRLPELDEREQRK